MSKEARYKAALRELEPNVRTAVLYLEALLREKHREALSAIPRSRPPDNSSVLVSIDSLQKQIDGLKDRIKDLKDFKDTAAVREKTVKRLANQGMELYETFKYLITFLRAKGYFKEGDLRKLREAGFMLQGRKVK